MKHFLTMGYSNIVKKDYEAARNGMTSCINLDPKNKEWQIGGIDFIWL